MTTRESLRCADGKALAREARAQLDEFVASNSRVLRAARELVCSQADVAGAAGAYQSQVAAVEHGTTYGIGADTLRRILAVYTKLFEGAA
jgi:hypothetical protein